MSGLTELLDRYGVQPFLHRCRVIGFEPFRVLRASVFGMLESLGAEDEILSRDLRWGLARLHHSVMHPLDELLAERLLKMDNRRARQYGEGFHGHLGRALECLDAMAGMPRNPVAGRVVQVVEGCLSAGETFRIFCPSSCRAGFENLLRDLGVEPDGLLLHTPSAWRSTPLFDVLIRVGPMRREGMGRMPPGILTAPRCRRLEQILWADMRNDEDAGFDAFGEWRVEQDTGGREIHELVPHGVQWRIEIEQESVKTELASERYEGLPETADAFEFEMVLRETGKADFVPAVVITVLDGRSRLLRPGSDTDCFVPHQEPPVEKCKARELKKGAYLILKRVDHAELAASPDHEFPHAQFWKRKLRERLVQAPQDLREELRQRGISLKNLDQALESWSRLEGGRLMAPRERRDRKILLEVLGLEGEAIKKALEEIAEYRGERVSDGKTAGELIDESVRQELESRVDEIREMIGRDPERHCYSLRLSGEAGLSGFVDLYPIIAVEPGDDDDHDVGDEAIFRVPPNMLDIWLRPEDAEAWRVGHARGEAHNAQ